MGPVIAEAVFMFAWFLRIAIFARVLLSWLPLNFNRNGIVFTIVHGITDPIISPVRKMIERSPLGGPGMMLDFSPVVTFLLIHVLADIIVAALR